MKKIKAISINGKPLKQCVLGGGKLMDGKKKLHTYRFRNTHVSYAGIPGQFQRLEKEGDSFEIEVNPISYGENFICARANRLCIGFLWDKTVRIWPMIESNWLYPPILESKRKPSGWVRIKVELAEGRVKLYLDGQLDNQTEVLDEYPVLFMQMIGTRNSGYAAYGFNGWVRGVRWHGGEWMDLSEIGFTATVEVDEANAPEKGW